MGNSMRCGLSVSAGSWAVVPGLPKGEDEPGLLDCWGVVVLGEGQDMKSLKDPASSSEVSQSAESFPTGAFVALQMLLELELAPLWLLLELELALLLLLELEGSLLRLLL